MAKMLVRALYRALTMVSITLSAGLVVIMAIMVGVGSISRYVLNRPIVMVDEFATFMLVAVTFIGAGYALKEGSHISIGIAVDRLPRRAAAWLRVFTDLFSIVGVVMLIVVTVQITGISFRAGSRTIAALAIPIAPVQLLMPIGLFLLLIEFVSVFLISIRSALQRSNVQESKG